MISHTFLYKPTPNYDYPTWPIQRGRKRNDITFKTLFRIDKDYFTGSHLRKQQSIERQQPIEKNADLLRRPPTTPTTPHTLDLVMTTYIKGYPCPAFTSYFGSTLLHATSKPRSSQQNKIYYLYTPHHPYKQPILPATLAYQPQNLLTPPTPKRAPPPTYVV